MSAQPEALKAPSVEVLEATIEQLRGQKAELLAFITSFAAEAHSAPACEPMNPHSFYILTLRADEIRRSYGLVA